MPSPAPRRRVLYGLAALVVIVLGVIFYLTIQPPAAAPQRQAASVPVAAPVPVAPPPVAPTAPAAAPAPDAITDYRGALDAARANPDRIARSRGFTRILQLWIERDPEAALAYVRGLPRSSTEFTQGVLLVLDVTAQRDIDRALSLAAELATTRDQQVFYSSLFDRLARENTPSAIEKLSAVPPGSGRDNALRAIAAEWAQRDFAAALAWAQQLPPADRTTAVESALRTSIPSDPLRVIELAKQSLSGPSLDRVLAAAVHQLVGSDLSSAAAIVPLLPSNETQMLGAVEVAQAMAAKNPSAALDWAKTLPDDTIRWLATRRALELWAVSDAAAATRYVSSLPAGKTQHDAVNTVAAAIAASNPQQAINWVQSMPSAETRAVALSNVANAWARNDPAAASRWVAAQPPDSFGPLGAKTLNATLSYWVLADAGAVQQFVSSLPAGTQASAAEFIAPQLAQTNPQAALGWAQTLPASEARNAALQSAYHRWLGNAPSEARAWLASANLPPDLKATLGK